MWVLFPAYADSGSTFSPICFFVADKHTRSFLGRN